MLCEGSCVTHAKARNSAFTSKMAKYFLKSICGENLIWEGFLWKKSRVNLARGFFILSIKMRTYLHAHVRVRAYVRLVKHPKPAAVTPLHFSMGGQLGSKSLSLISPPIVYIQEKNYNNRVFI